MAQEFEFHPLIQRYLDRLKGLTSSDATYKTRRSDLKLFNQWVRENGHDLEEMEPLEVEAYFIHLKAEGYAPNTVSSRFDSIRVFFRDVVEKFEAREENPVEALDRCDYVEKNTRKHDETEITYVTPEEKEQLAEHVVGDKIRNELIIRLLWQTGLRESELAGIKLENVDREERSIKVWSPKVRDWRTVYYQPSAEFLLNQWLEGGYRARFTSADDSEYLFVTRKRPQLRDERSNKVVRKAAENAGIQEVMYQDKAGQNRYRITAHALRHGHAVHALKCGIDVRTVQKHMGHSSLDMTMQYLQLIDEDVKQNYKRFGHETRQ